MVGPVSLRVQWPAGSVRSSLGMRPVHERRRLASHGDLPHHGSGATLTTMSTASRPPDRNLALELVRVTEAAALAASRWVGRGDKNGADGAAVAAMRTVLSTVTMDGVVVIGEGEKDNAPMLYNGEQVGDGSPPLVDVAVDPDRRDHADGAGPHERAVGDRGQRPRVDVRPGALVLHGEDRRRPGVRRLDRHHRLPDPEPAVDRQGQAGERA